MAADTRSRVVVVTGGAVGIGAAIAEESARRGDFVVTLDPVVELDGSPTSGSAASTTAERIVAAGGRARASNASVTDANAVRALLRGLVDEFGGVDAIVNVAGISRPTGFAHGEEEDWRRVLDVHLGGYLTVLREALPIMAEAGRGQILGVTSGSGWREADAGAYSCAKRAVASLTWQLGASPPVGVTINALSPIAATRMVARALARMEAQRRAGDHRDASGGVGLGAAPPPENLGPIGAYLASEAFAWCSGRIFFSNGAEISLVEPPRPMESLPTSGAASLAGLLEAATPTILATAEKTQVPGGGTVARLGSGFAASPPPPAPEALCLLVTDDEAWRLPLLRSLRERGLSVVEGDARATGFAATARQIDALDRPPAAVILALCGRLPGAPGRGWEQILADHEGIEDALMRDAAWLRAVAERSARDASPTRVIDVVSAQSPDGRTRAMSIGQLSRAAHGATGGRMDAFALGVRSTSADSRDATATLAAHLARSEHASALSGAEFFVDAGHLGIHCHPYLAGSLSYGGPHLPDWLGVALQNMCGGAGWIAATDGEGSR